MKPRCADETDVRAVAVEPGDSGGTTGNDGMPEESAADDFNNNPIVIEQFHRDIRAVRDDGRVKTRPQMRRELKRRCAAIDKNNLTWIYHGGGVLADTDLLGGGNADPVRKGRVGGRQGHGPAMNALQPSLLRQFAQITPDGVLGKTQLSANILGDNAAVLLKNSEEMRFSFMS